MQRNELGQFAKIPLTFQALKLSCQRNAKGCWNWTGNRLKAGYGKIHRKDFGGRVRTLLVHRVMWWLTHGPIPKGKVVMHRCDNPSCCNPDHLELGTHLQNVRDCLIRGRIRCGEKSHRAKLTRAQALEALRSPLAASRIAAKFGVCRTTISELRHGRSWRCLRKKEHGSSIEK